VVEDPLERGNLKERHKDIYDRIVAEWQAWNASMLPEIAESFTRSFTGEELADHSGCAYQLLPYSWSDITELLRPLAGVHLGRENVAL